MDLFLDTSFIIPLIIETDTTDRARNFYASFSGSCAASMSVYEEAFFIGLRLLAEDQYGITNTTQLKTHIREEGYGFADEFISHLNEFFSAQAIVQDSTNLQRIEEIARKYALLPNDALIVATCRDNRIPNLATFDRDFASVKDPVRVKI